MATPKLNPSRSIVVIPSDYCNIPNPALLITESVVNSSLLGQYVTDQNLVALGVKTGDIIYDYIDNYGVTITSLSFDGTLTTVQYNNSVYLGEGETVKIYSGADDSTGAVLYVGNGGDIRVTTEGGDDVLLANVPSGSFLPIQVLKIHSSDTTATSILALR